MANQAKCPSCKVRFVWHAGYVSQEDLEAGRCSQAVWDEIQGMTRMVVSKRGVTEGMRIAKGLSFPLGGRYVCPRCGGPLAATSHLSQLPIVAELPTRKGWK
jgi:hypothetical protein